jgi:hypothetical protein
MKWMGVGCAVLSLLIMKDVMAAAPRPDVARCANYAKLVTDRQPFKDGSVTVDNTSLASDVQRMLQACPSQAKLAKALYVPLEFMDRSGEEDEGGKAWAPEDTTTTIAEAMTAARADVQKTVDGYKHQVKNGAVDEQYLKAALRYLIWNRTPYSPYRYTGLELLARMYPADYAGVKELSKDEHGYANWDEVAQDWMPKTPPAKH